MNNQGTRPKISVVIPLYNEVDGLIPLLQALRDALVSEQTPNAYRDQAEVILVDDGSTDGTSALLRDILLDQYQAPAKDVLALPSHLVGVFFRRNYGQTAALAAGFRAAQGELIVTMDGDLQQEPLDMFPMLEKLERESLDVVSGWRRRRQDDWLRTRLSQIANGLIRLATGVYEVSDLGCSLKVYRAEILADIQLFGQMHRFIPVLAKMEGARLGQMEVRHRPRRFGASKYGLGRTFRVFCDLVLLHYLTRMATRPIHWFGAIALTLGALAAVTAVTPTWMVTPLLALVTGMPNAAADASRRFLVRLVLLTFAVSIALTALTFMGLGVVAEIGIRAWYAQEATPSGRRPLYRIRERLERHERSKTVSSFGFRAN
jgi:glycosyltransferase involved in cell wall biosynthesis